MPCQHRPVAHTEIAEASLGFSSLHAFSSNGSIGSTLLTSTFFGHKKKKFDFFRLGLVIYLLDIIECNLSEEIDAKKIE
jgi:hypothetical protein